MEYNVPQFIEEESRVVGPLTLRQFFIALGLLIPISLLFMTLKLWIAIILAFIIVAAAIFVMFGKIEGRPVSDIVFSAIRFFWLPRLFLWKKPMLTTKELIKEMPTSAAEEKATAEKKPSRPKTLTPEDIQKLAKQLDIK